MTVEKELKKCLLLYPSVFSNKWSVYHHWFCVGGNGYCWKNGELVDSNEDIELTIKDSIEKHFEIYITDINNSNDKLFDLKFYIERLKKQFFQIWILRIELRILLHKKYFIHFLIKRKF